MSLDLGAQRDAIALQIQTALDLSTQPANCYGYPPDSPELNAVLVMPRLVDGHYVGYHGTFTGAQGALCLTGWTVEVRCGGGQIDAAKAMDKYLSSGNAESVLDALLADPTLGGEIETLAIGGSTVPRWFQASETDSRNWLSASFDVDTHARRDNP